MQRFFSPQRFLEWDYIDYIMIVMVFPRYYWWFSHHYINIINDCDPSSPVSQMQPLLQYSTDGILLNHPTGTYPPHWQLSTKEPVHKWAQHGDNAQKKCLNVWRLSHSKHLFKSFTYFYLLYAQIKMDWHDRAGSKCGTALRYYMVDRGWILIIHVVYNSSECFMNQNNHAT